MAMLIYTDVYHCIIYFCFELLRTVVCVEIFKSDTGGLALTFLFLSLAVPAVFGGRTISCVAPLFLVGRFAGF